MHEIMAQGRWHGRRLHAGRKHGKDREVAGVMLSFPDFKYWPYTYTEICFIIHPGSWSNFWGPLQTKVFVEPQ